MPDNAAMVLGMVQMNGELVKVLVQARDICDYYGQDTARDALADVLGSVNPALPVPGVPARFTDSFDRHSDSWLVEPWHGKASGLSGPI